VNAVNAVIGSTDVVLERAELLVPVRLKLVEPGLERRDGLGPEAEDAQPCIVRHALVGDQTRLEENPQVPAHDRRRGAGGRSKLTCAVRAVPEKLHDAAPRRIGERAEEAFHIVDHVRNC
jgi:hypothetical protein